MLKRLPQFFCSLALLATPVGAQDYVAQKGLEKIEFLHGWRTSKGTHMAAMRITLEDGWKTYWRAPGGAGIPPSFKWKGSSNIASVRYHWPSPKLYLQNGIPTIGYKDELILPIEFKPLVQGKPITIKSRVDFGICKDVCIPVASKLDINLASNHSKDKALIKNTLSKKPKSAKSSGLKSVSCVVNPIDDGLEIKANMTFKNEAPAVQKIVIEFAQPNIWIEQTGLKKSNKHLTASAELVSFSGQPFFIDRSKLRLTLISEKQALEINGCPAPS